MPTTATISPIDLALRDLSNAARRFKEARISYPEDFRERIAILEGETEGLIDGTKRLVRQAEGVAV